MPAAVAGRRLRPGGGGGGRRALPVRYRRQQVDEYYRVLPAGGLLTILDTPNRWFPLETHSVGLPLVQWLPPRFAYHYARLGRRRRYGAVSFKAFVADGTGSRNARFADCLPSAGPAGVHDLTEAGYGWRFFRATARSRTRRALLPLFGAPRPAGRGRPAASVALPYLDLLFRPHRKASGDGEDRDRPSPGPGLPAAPAPDKIALWRRSRQRLDTINHGFNERIYSARVPPSTTASIAMPRRSRRIIRCAGWWTGWAAGGYGRALELGAGSGYFTALIAPHANWCSPWNRCRTCKPSSPSAAALPGSTTCAWSAPPRSASPPTSARRQSIRRSSCNRCITSIAARSSGPSVASCGRAAGCSSSSHATTCGESPACSGSTCRSTARWPSGRRAKLGHSRLPGSGKPGPAAAQGGFTDIRMDGYWIPYSRWLIGDARRRFEWERTAGRLPGLRHFAAVLALTARRRDDGRG